MFKKSTRNLWINYLSGTLDDCHVVDMIIGTDGTSCRGLYTLRSSNTTFFFDGIEKNHSLHLTEYSTEDVPTGIIWATYDGERFDAVWQGLDKNRPLPMSLSIVSQFEQYAMPDKLSDHWFRNFSGRVNGEDMALSIGRINNAYDILWATKDTSAAMTLSGKGISVEIFNADIKNFPLGESALMVASVLPEKADVIIKDENDYTSIVTLNLDQAIDYEPLSFANFHTLLVGEIPRTGHKKFDAWIKEETADILESVLQQHKKIKYGELGLRNKWIHQTDCWVEWDLVSKDWISGTLHLQSSLQRNMIKKSFIYDLRSSKLVNLDDFLISKSIKSSVVGKALYKVLETRQYPDDLKIEDLKYVTMDAHGFNFASDFCPIRGETVIHLPFKNIEQSLRNKNLLRNLLPRR